MISCTRDNMAPNLDTTSYMILKAFKTRTGVLPPGKTPDVARASTSTLLYYRDGLLLRLPGHGCRLMLRARHPRKASRRSQVYLDPGLAKKRQVRTPWRVAEFNGYGICTTISDRHSWGEGKTRKIAQDIRLSGTA